MRKTAVIFDLDGTLLDTIQDLANAVNAMCVQFSYPTHSVETVKGFVGNGMRKLIERAIPGGLANPSYEACHTAFKQYYNEHCMDTTKPYDGIQILLEECQKRGVLTGICSNKADDAVQVLKHTFFAGTIEIAVGQTDATNKKPAPDTLWLAAKQLGVAMEQVLYVGDSDVDYYTAKNAGADCVLVSWGFRDRQQLLALPGAHVIDEPEALFAYLN